MTGMWSSDAQMKIPARAGAVDLELVRAGSPNGGNFFGVAGRTGSRLSTNSDPTYKVPRRVQGAVAVVPAVSWGAG